MGVRALRRAVFLDRDGVLNRAIMRGGRPFPPAGIAELELVPNALQALELLRERDFLTIVVTNQPDVARGTQTQAAVEAINAYIAVELPLDAMYVCYHDNEDACACRKPKPGLVQRASKEHGIDVGSSYLIGDRYKDIDCGSRAGCRTILIDYGYAEPKGNVMPDFTVTTLIGAVHTIIAEERKSHEYALRIESQDIR